MPALPCRSPSWPFVEGDRLRLCPERLRAGEGLRNGGVGECDGGGVGFCCGFVGFGFCLVLAYFWFLD